MSAVPSVNKFLVFVATLGTSAALLTGAISAVPAQASSCSAEPITSGDGQGAPYEIATVGQLQTLKDDSSYWDDSVILTANINMSGCPWTTTVGTTDDAFTGVFDGDGKSISNISVNVTEHADDTTYAAGLIGALDQNGVVKDLAVTGDVYLNASELTPGSYEPRSMAGGIVGFAEGAEIANVSFTGTVTVDSGFDEHPYAGGLVGVSLATGITSSWADADVSASAIGARSGVGGLAGLFQDDTIDRSYALGSAHSDVETSYVGGLVGTTRGVTPYSGTATVVASFATVEVSSPDGDVYAGGLVGEGAPTISDSFALGALRLTGGNANGTIGGGLVGYMMSDSPIVQSYSATIIPGATPRLGGLVGMADNFTPTISDSYWDTDLTMKDSAIGSCDNATCGANPTAVGKTSGQMSQLGTFSGWSIATAWAPGQTWNLCAPLNGGRPFLTGIFSGNPCGVTIPTLTPSTQGISGVIGEPLTSSAMSPTGFLGAPRFEIPLLPAGLSGNSSTGVISGSPLTGLASTTYRIYGFGHGPTNPMASASVTIAIESPSSAYAVVGAIEGCDSWGFADNTPDGSVAVGCLGGKFVGVIPPGMTDGMIDDTVAVPMGAYYVTVDPDDGTIYTGTSDDSHVAVVRAPYPDSTDDSVNVGANVSALGVGDDTVYVGTVPGLLSSFPTSMSAGQYADQASIGGDWPYGIAVTDDTVYVTDTWHNRLITVDPATLAVEQDDTSYSEPSYPVTAGNGATLYLGTTEHVKKLNGGSLVQQDSSTALTPTSWYRSLALSDGKVFSYGGDLNTLTVLDDATLDVLAYVDVDAWSESIAVSDRGIVYVPSSYGGSWPAEGVQTIAELSSSMPTSTGVEGDAINVAIDPVPNDVVVSEETVTSLTFGQDQLPFTWTADNEISFTVPAGTGSKTVVLSLKGGNTIASGVFTYYTPNPGPVPNPGVRPSAPLSVLAYVGDAEAIVSWQTPQSEGTFAISSYEVTASPGGRSCLATAPARTCTVMGLTNGTSYTFRVRALNGAGWSGYSQPSNAVTPSRTPGKAIVIKGSRGADGADRRITVRGTTSDMVGTVVTPFFRLPGESSFREGSRTRTIDANGTFTWSRKTGKKIHIYFEGGGVRSNRIVIAAR